MFGYPRRQNNARRLAPTTQLFDPSADAACTGWWRADSNVQISNTQRSNATAWTSKLPSARVFTLTGGVPWLFLENVTGGWPGLLGSGGMRWDTQGIAENGDREFTFTFVFRGVLWAVGSDQYLITMANMLWILLNGGYPRTYHPVGGWWNIIDNRWYAFGPDRLSVMTVRMKPYSAPDDMRGYYTLNFDNDHVGPIVEGSGWGDRALSETSILSIYGFYGSPVIWQEVIAFRRCLSDAEVTAMHQSLMQQYYVAI